MKNKPKTKETINWAASDLQPRKGVQHKNDQPPAHGREVSQLGSNNQRGERREPSPGVLMPSVCDPCLLCPCTPALITPPPLQSTNYPQVSPGRERGGAIWNRERGRESNRTEHWQAYVTVTLNDVDALLVYFTRVQHLLGCMFYMLCYMRPMKLVCIPAHCNSKVEEM